jgi:hypothetical protein
MFVAEVVGRCNGACIRGTLHKESGGQVPLPEGYVSTISIGQSCFIMFSPAIRGKPTTVLTPQPSLDEVDMDASDIENQPEEISGLKSTIAPPIGLPAPTTGPGQPKRFPKLWSKAIMDVFHASNTFELSQIELLTKFKVIHSSACSAYFGEVNQNLEDELWSNLKRFVTKTPFEFEEESSLIRFDPSAVKPRAPPVKRAKVDEESSNSTPVVQPAPTVGDQDTCVVDQDPV